MGSTLKESLLHTVKSQHSTKSEAQDNFSRRQKWHFHIWGTITYVKGHIKVLIQEGSNKELKIYDFFSSCNK